MIPQSISSFHQSLCALASCFGTNCFMVGFLLRKLVSSLYIHYYITSQVLNTLVADPLAVLPICSQTTQHFDLAEQQYMLWFSRQLLLLAIRYHQAASPSEPPVNKAVTLDCEKTHQQLPVPLTTSYNLARSCTMRSIPHNHVKTAPLVLRCGCLCSYICWFTENHNTISWKVGQKSAKLYVTLVCLFVSVCMYVRSENERRRRRRSMCETQMGAEGPAEGYPDRPQNSPEQHPA